MATLNYMQGQWELDDAVLADVKQSISNALASGHGWVTIATPYGTTVELCVTPGVPIVIDSE